MSLAKNLVALASLTSAVSIVLAIGVFGFILNDVNNFYDDAMVELDEFKLIANTAWNHMTTTIRDESVRKVRSVFRSKKQAGSTCNCAEGPNDCPPGPPGPPGEPGAPGEDGAPGEVGAAGTTGTGGSTKDNGECIKCPAGPPGEPGPDGTQGPAGSDGQSGDPGAPGQDGQPGAPGEQGDAGAAGENGTAGEAGPAGQNGKTGRGKPGSAGNAGPPGPAGQPGQDGGAGLDGLPGQEGPEGPAGNDGTPGQDGEPGAPGNAGVPGGDAAYCSCPPRTGEVLVDSKSSQKDATNDAGYETVEEIVEIEVPEEEGNKESEKPALSGSNPTGYSRQRASKNRNRRVRVSKVVR